MIINSSTVLLNFVSNIIKKILIFFSPFSVACPLLWTAVWIMTTHFWPGPNCQWPPKRDSDSKSIKAFTNIRKLESTTNRTEHKICKKIEEFEKFQDDPVFKIARNIKQQPTKSQKILAKITERANFANKLENKIGNLKIVEPSKTILVTISENSLHKRVPQSIFSIANFNSTNLYNKSNLIKKQAITDALNHERFNLANFNKNILTKWKRLTPILKCGHEKGQNQVTNLKASTIFTPINLFLY